MPAAASWGLPSPSPKLGDDGLLTDFPWEITCQNNELVREKFPLRGAGAAGLEKRQSQECPNPAAQGCGVRGEDQVEVLALGVLLAACTTQPPGAALGRERPGQEEGAEHAGGQCRRSCEPQSQALARLPLSEPLPAGHGDLRVTGMGEAPAPAQTRLGSTKRTLCLVSAVQLLSA